jgi:hypothetical protein
MRRDAGAHGNPASDTLNTSAGFCLVSLNSLSVAGDIHTPKQFGKTPSARCCTRCVAAENEKGFFDDEF